MIAPRETIDEAELVAARIAARIGRDPAVIAVALGGSWATGVGEVASDIDLYVYAIPSVSLAVRSEIATEFSGGDGTVSLDNRFWELGDEWRDAESGVWIDVMFRSPGWVEDQLARVLDRHEASIGYSTSFWHNVLTSRSLFDRSGWFGGLQDTARRPYPDALKRAIVAKNQPILSTIHCSYRSQIAAALRRGDYVTVNHRIAAFLASVFDIVFALNGVPHPGEKRQMTHAVALCPLLPTRFSETVDGILHADGDPETLLGHLDRLMSAVDSLLREAHLLPNESP